MNQEMSAPKVLSTVNPTLNLHVGEWVEVRSVEEIMATLDAAHCVDRLPFMPEMIQYCGRRFRVFKSAHKTADTSEFYTIRRMANAVHLENVRCDGAGHGGCQAACLVFWKEAWLKRLPSDQGIADCQNRASEPASGESGHTAIQELLEQSGRCLAASGEVECYRCQATEMVKATGEVRRRERWNPLFYVKDITSGNVKLVDFVRFGLFAVLNAFLIRWFGFRLPRLRGLAGDETPTGNLNLQPGDRVRVRSKEKIEATLSNNLRNRGMWFDVEMLAFCGKGPFMVRGRVERIVNEKTGEMMALRNPCIILDGVTCSGNYLYQRMFSPRHEYPFWREIWLERITEHDGERVAK